LLSNPAASLAEIPAGSAVLQLAVLPPEVLSARTTTPSAVAPSVAAAPGAGAAPAASIEAVPTPTGAALRTTGHAAMDAVPDKPAASEAPSDNPYR